MLKSFIIYLPKSKKSTAAAIKSIDRFKEVKDINVIKWEGIDRYNVWQKFIDSEFKLLARNRFGAGYIDTELAVFFSHYSLWQKCLELKENILILEHDAWVLEDFNIDNLINFKGDILNIGKPNWGSIYNSNFKSEWLDKPAGITKREICNNKHDIYKVWSKAPGLCHCDTMWLFGAHAYVLTPTGATKLIESTKKGILPADLYINQDNVTIHDYLPHPVSQASTFTLTQYNENNESDWDY
jgi:GR25 family glycosyltransferase involved in LPS biosynthesis